MSRLPCYPPRINYGSSDGSWWAYCRRFRLSYCRVFGMSRHQNRLTLPMTRTGGTELSGLAHLVLADWAPSLLEPLSWAFVRTNLRPGLTQFRKTFLSRIGPPGLVQLFIWSYTGVRHSQLWRRLIIPLGWVLASRGSWVSERVFSLLYGQASPARPGDCTWLGFRVVPRRA